MKRSIYLNCLIVLGMVALAGCAERQASSVAQSKTSCSELSGTWSGDKKGQGYQGKVKLVVDNDCSYEFFWIERGDGCKGNLTAIKPAAEFKYQQDCGSRGTVKVAENKMHWRNTFTGNNYDINLQKK